MISSNINRNYFFSCTILLIKFSIFKALNSNDIAFKVQDKMVNKQTSSLSATSHFCSIGTTTPPQFDMVRVN